MIPNAFLIKYCMIKVPTFLTSFWTQYLLSLPPCSLKYTSRPWWSLRSTSRIHQTSSERVVGGSVQCHSAKEERLWHSNRNRKESSNRAVGYHLCVWSSRGKWSGADFPWHWTSLEVLSPISYLGRDFPEVKGLGAIQGQTDHDSMPLHQLHCLFIMTAES